VPNRYAEKRVGYTYGIAGCAGRPWWWNLFLLLFPGNVCGAVRTFSATGWGTGYVINVKGGDKYDKKI